MKTASAQTGVPAWLLWGAWHGPFTIVHAYKLIQKGGEASYKRAHGWYQWGYPGSRDLGYGRSRTIAGCRRQIDTYMRTSYGHPSKEVK